MEFKTNLLAPAKGERFAFRATVVKPGRTLTVCEARAFAEHDGVETLVATMTGTLMALHAAPVDGTTRPPGSHACRLKFAPDIDMRLASQPCTSDSPDTRRNICSRRA